MALVYRLALKDFAAELGKAIDYQPLIDQIAEKLVSDAKQRFAAGVDPDGKAWAPLKHPRPNSKGADIPLNDFGILRSSLVPGNKGAIFEKTDRLIIHGTNLDYACTQHYGAVITPKNAQYLAIPATMEARRTGSPRNWPKDQLKFRFGKKGGVAFTTQVKGRGKKMRLAEVVQYYFTKSVTIPPRPFVGLSDKDKDDLVAMAQEYVMDVLHERLRGSGGV